MAKKNVVDVTKEVYQLLKPLEADDRSRVINAVLALLGQEQITSQGGGVGTPSEPQNYFVQKDPRTKVEILAVAARFREQHQNQHKHKREDFKSVIKGARRNFDTHNFSWDIRNAKNKGLFNTGKDIQLSYYGQQYVDTLPDREKLKKLRAPTGRRKKKAKKKKTKAKARKT